MSSIRNKWGVSLLVLAFSVSANNVFAQTCVPHPTCAELGYDKKESDCGKNATVRCPFNKAEVFCTAYTDKEGTTLPKAGDILFSDKTWGPELRTDKRAIGVIVDGSGLAISLDAAQFPWGKADSNLSLGTDGKFNTSKIVEHLTTKGVSGQYAAKHCKEYATPKTNPGDWFMPSQYETSIIFNNFVAINNGLAKAGGYIFDDIEVHCVTSGTTKLVCRVNGDFLGSMKLMVSNQAPYNSGNPGTDKNGLYLSYHFSKETDITCTCSEDKSSSNYCGNPDVIKSCEDKALKNVILYSIQTFILQTSDRIDAPTRCLFQFK